MKRVHLTQAPSFVPSGYRAADSIYAMPMSGPDFAFDHFCNL